MLDLLAYRMMIIILNYVNINSISKEVEFYTIQQKDIACLKNNVGLIQVIFPWSTYCFCETHILTHV